MEKMDIQILVTKFFRVTRRVEPVFFILLIVGFSVLFIILYVRFSTTMTNYDLLLPDQDLSGASQDNPDLIAYINQLHIQAPSEKDYNLQKPEIEDSSQNGQGKLIARVFKEKKKGTFLEAGAYNGEELSNTLYLERKLGWTGLLVEPDPWNFWALKKRSRKAHSIQCCLSPFPYPREVSFRQSDTMGHVENSAEIKRKGIFTRVKCFPLYSLMLARNLTSLDLLSLDIEGKEMEVLETLPWDKINIKVILIEVSHLPKGKDYLMKYLRKRNYLYYSAVGEDYIFVKLESNS